MFPFRLVPPPVLVTLLFIAVPWSPLMSQSADLSVSQSVSSDPLTLGDDGTFTLTVSNAGPDTATDVVVQDSLPPGAVFVSADNGGVYDNLTHQVSWSIGTLPADESRTLSMTLTTMLPEADAEIEIFFNGQDTAGETHGIYHLPIQTGVGAQIQTIPTATAPRDQAVQTDGTLLLLDEGAATVLDENDQGVIDGALIQILEKQEPIVLSSGGLLVNPNGLALAADGTIYVADPDGVRLSGDVVLPDQNGRIIAINPQSGIQTLVAEGDLLEHPVDLVFDDQGRLLVLDRTGKLIRVTIAGGGQELLSSGTFLIFPTSLARDLDGNLFALDAESGIVRLEGESFAQALLVDITLEPALIQPNFIQVALNGDLFVSDRDGSGALLQFEDQTGVLEGQFPGGAGAGFTQPTGLTLNHGFTNSVNVIASSSDPNSDNDQFPLFIVVIPPRPLQTTVVINVTETMTATDTATLTPAVMIDVTESIGIADSQTFPAGPEVTAAETISLTDNAVVQPAVMISVTETVTTSDGGQPQTAPRIDLTDAVSLSDTATVDPAAQIQVTETLGVTESVIVDGVAGPPRVLNLFGNGVLIQPGDEQLNVVTQFRLQFNELITDPEGDDDPGDVSNPTNYLVVNAGEDGVFDTEDCESGVGAGDLGFEVTSVAWNAVATTATLRLNAPTALPSGRYRLYACHNLTDLGGAPLDGNGDGVGGDDFVVEFTLLSENLLVNPNLDTNLDGWAVQMDDGMTLTHDTDVDVNAWSTSGSARFELTAGNEAELFQCLTVQPGQWYRLGGRLKVTTTHPGAMRPRAKLSWHASPQCEDPPLSTWTLPVNVGDTGELWIPFNATRRAPEGAVAARVSYGIEENDGGQAVLHWDGLFLSADTGVVLSDGFESGDLINWDQ